jgi:hypothetical protein
VRLFRRDGDQPAGDAAVLAELNQGQAVRSESAAYSTLERKRKCYKALKHEEYCISNGFLKKESLFTSFYTSSLRFSK